MATLDDPVKGPVLKAAQTWAHARGLSQREFSEMMGLYAAVETAGVTALNAAKQHHLEALGPAGGPRIDAVSQFLTAAYPKAAQAMISTLVTKDQVEAWEDIIVNRTAQGGAQFSQIGRDHSKPTVPDAEYDRMTYGQKKEYAASHANGKAS